MALNFAELEIRVSTADSINAMKALIKEVTSLRNELKFGSAEFKQTEQILSGLNNRMRDVTHGSLSNFGQAMRNNTMVAMNFGRILQDLPFGLMAIANNIDPLVLSLQSLRKESEAAGISMKTALLSSFSGPGGLLAVVGMVSIAFTLLPKLLRATRDASYDTALALSKLSYEMGKISFDQRLDALGRMKEKTQEHLQSLARRRAMMSFMGATLPGAPSPEDIAGAQLEANRAAQEYELFLRGEPVKEERTASESAVRSVTGYGERSAMIYDRFGGFRSGDVGTMGAAVKPLAGFGQAGANLFATPNMPYGPKRSELSPLTKEALEINGIWQSGIQSLNVGVMSVANTIRTSVSMAWEQAFGRANSLLEIFAQNVLSTMAGNLAQGAFASLLGLIPGIGSVLEAAAGGGIFKSSFVGGGYRVVENVGRNTNAAYKRGFYGY